MRKNFPKHPITLFKIQVNKPLHSKEHWLANLKQVKNISGKNQMKPSAFNYLGNSNESMKIFPWDHLKYLICSRLVGENISSFWDSRSVGHQLFHMKLRFAAHRLLHFDCKIQQTWIPKICFLNVMVKHSTIFRKMSLSFYLWLSFWQNWKRTRRSGNLVRNLWYSLMKDKKERPATKLTKRKILTYYPYNNIWKYRPM